MKEINSVGCQDYHFTRRNLMKLGLSGLAFSLLPAWLPRVVMATQQTGAKRDVIVAVFLRGGADGLSLVAPFGDSAYYSLRPTLALAQPDSGKAGACINLNGFFGIHPGMKPLMGAYNNGDLAIVHATGGIPNNWTRSHFDAQRWMELGKPNDLSITTGWLGRHLQTMPALKSGSLLRGVGIEYGLAQSLVGGPQSLPIDDPANYGYDGSFQDESQMAKWLSGAYTRTTEPVKSNACNAQAVVSLLQSIDFANYKPAGGATYPDSDLGHALRAAAALIRADFGVEAITVDSGNWDTHSSQGNVTGTFNDNATDLGSALAAFYTDHQSANRKDVLTVTMSEFGRDAIENNSQGTDHGTANAMMLLGSGVNGGRVYASWPGLGPGQLFEDQDLAITTDYRDVLSEVVSRRLGNGTSLGQIFPGYTPNYHGILKPMT